MCVRESAGQQVLLEIDGLDVYLAGDSGYELASGVCITPFTYSTSILI